MTEGAREVARDLLLELGLSPRVSKFRLEITTKALDAYAAARVAEERAALAPLMCAYCSGGLPTHAATPIQNESGRWIHPHVDSNRSVWLPCHADKIRQRATPTPGVAP